MIFLFSLNIQSLSSNIENHSMYSYSLKQCCVLLIIVTIIWETELLSLVCDINSLQTHLSFFGPHTKRQIMLSHFIIWIPLSTHTRFPLFSIKSIIKTLTRRSKVLSEWYNFEAQSVLTATLYPHFDDVVSTYIMYLYLAILSSSPDTYILKQF